MVVDPTGNLLFQQPLVFEQDSGLLVGEGAAQVEDSAAMGQHPRSTQQKQRYGQLFSVKCRG